jgi:hypothetical protein
MPHKHLTLAVQDINETSDKLLEATNAIGRLTQKKFLVRGQKMYIWKLDDLIDVLSKQELKTFMKMCNDTENISNANLLLESFKYFTEDMTTVARSRFKKKLLDSGAIHDHHGLLIINPFILVPRQDKNIPNFQYLVQRIYKYLVQDKDLHEAGEDMQTFIDIVYPEFKQLNNGDQ